MEDKCRRCGRALKDPDSQAKGIGPVCERNERAEGFVAEQTKGHKHADIAIETTMIDGYVGSIDLLGNSRVVTIRAGKMRNLRHVIYHSPNGFSWGYGGSGPADLARSILADAVTLIVGDARGMYQDFKWDFLAKLKQDQGWEIPLNTVIEWVNRKLKEVD